MNIKFEGIQVEQSFLRNETQTASEANFILENNSSQPVSVEIIKVNFHDGNKEENIKVFYLYSGDNELKNPFNVNGNSAVNFRITFPFRNIQIKLGNQYEVSATASIDGKTQLATSRLNFVEEGIH
jgi:hypothetical protein